MTFHWLFLVTWLTLTSRSLSQNIDCANPADIIFLMDGSNSIDAQEWNQERQFVARMVNNLDISINTINVGYTVYSSQVDSIFGLTPFRPKIVLTARARTLEHPTGIATNTAAGISSTIQTFRAQPMSRRNAPKILIVITDGSSENPAETIRQAQLAKEQGIRIITVGVGNNVFHEELQQIASNAQKYYRAPDFAALRGIESDIRNMICRVITTTQSPRVTFTPPTTPPGVIPHDSDKICNNSADIVFVIDGSDSISDADFVRLKNFVANLIDNFEIGQEAIHVGMIVYSSLIGDRIGLFPPHSKMLLKFFATNLKHPKFGTDTAAGIESAVNMIKEQGRPNAPKMIVVITDGRSVNPRNTFVQASMAKTQDITMIAIGVGRDIFSEELSNIASGPGFVSEVADFTSLSNTVNVMRNLICTSIVVTTEVVPTIPPTPPPSIEPPKEGIICNVPGDVIILLDGSDSIKPPDWIKQVNFAANLINNLEIGQPYIHIGVVVYSSTIGDTINLVPFNPKPVIVRMVKGLNHPRFGTDTALGIKTVLEMFKSQGRPNAPKVAIVVTDGKSTYPDNTFVQANMAKANGVTMISVGVGSDIFDTELVNIATSPGQVFRVADFASLRQIIGTLRDKICQVVQTTTLAPETTTTPPTTTTPMPTPQPIPLIPCAESRTEAELVFLLDGSKSMTPYNWMMGTHFVSNFLDGMDIQKNYMHVGVVVSDQVRADSVSISPFKNRYHLKELVHGFKHPSGDMDLATGLRKVQEILQESRRNAQRVVVLLTDVNSRSFGDTAREANRLKAQGVNLVTMGVGNRVNMAQLGSLATKPGYTISANNFQQAFSLLPRLQNVVCEILKKPETTTLPPTTTTTPKPSLCDGCLIDQGVGYNPYPGDCTKYVQCWKVGDEVRALVRSCPFGQFWDADAITCRPSFLVRCTADPCRFSEPGFSYGMVEYGCKAYWKCMDGFSVGHCCPSDSKYVEGIGCLAGAVCNDECPPLGGIAIKPICDKKSHWDKRFYIQIIYGRGEIVRPCPVGTIFFEDRCSCDFGMSGLLPATPDVRCQPSAFFNFDADMLDKSPNSINVGITQLRLTDLGTAYFNGRSEMNLWRFAGADWGNQLVIKFKFRFDYSNKFIDYGGLPVDLDLDFDINMNLISDYEMTDLDWRLWNQLRNVRSLQDWQNLLREFGQARTFYIFLGQLGFKPGTSNSLQVMRILGTPRAYQEFLLLLQKLHQSGMGDMEWRSRTSATSGVGGQGSADLRSGGTSGLKGILSQLRSMRGYINWNNIVGTGSAGSETGGITIDGFTVPPTGGTGSWKWDGSTGQWVQVNGGIDIPLPTTGPDGNLLNVGGADAASEWKWNSVTGQWERLASVNSGSGVASGGSHMTSGQQWSAGGSFAGGSQSGGGSGRVPAVSMEDMLRQMQKVQNASSSGAWSWNTTGSMVGGGAEERSRAAVEELLRRLKLAAGQSGSASWSWNRRNGTTSGTKLDTKKLQELLAQVQKTATGNGRNVGSGWGSNFNMTSSFVTSGGKPVVITGGMGSNTGSSGQGESKRTIQVRQDQKQPTDSVVGGRVVGGSFQTSSSSTSGQASRGQTGSGGRTVGGSFQTSSFTSSQASRGQTGSGGRAVGGSFQTSSTSGQTSRGQTGSGGPAVGGSFKTSSTSGQTSRGQSGSGGRAVGGSFQTSSSTSGQSPRGIPSSGGRAFGGSFQTSVSTSGQASRGQTGSGGRSAGGSFQMSSSTSGQTSRGQTGFGGRAVGGSFQTSSSTSGQSSRGQTGSGGRAFGGSFQTSLSTSGQASRGQTGSGGRAFGGSFQTSSSTSGQASRGQTGSGGRTVGGSLKMSSTSGQTSRGQTGFGGRGLGGSFQTSSSTSGQASRGQTGSGSQSSGGMVFQETSSRNSKNQGANAAAGVARGATAQTRGGNTQGRWVGSNMRGSGSEGSLVRQTVQLPSKPGMPNRSALRGVNAKGVISQNVDGAIIGLRMPSGGDFISGATVIGKGERAVDVTNTGTQTRIKDIVQEMKPVTFESQVSDGLGGSSSSGGSFGGSFGSFSSGASSGAAGGMAGGSGAAGSGNFMGGRQSLASGTSGLAGGDFTQMGRVAGSGGGVRTVVESNVKRVPSGSAQFSGQGVVNLNSLGLGGASGTQRVRQVVSQPSGAGAGASSGSFSMGGSGTGSNSFGMANLLGTQNQQQGSASFFPFFSRDTVSDFMDAVSGKRRKRRSVGGRSRRAVNKRDYQALVTNCQGQNGQGPSIMVVANEGDVQFALKTDRGNEPGIVSVPAVEGWNDVTLIYDGKTLTGIVENWQGFHKSSTTLTGNVERRQAGLLVGSCQGFKSFHGEMDDLTIYKCLTPAAQALRDRIMV